jgi:LPS-assembly lipoprotein
MGAYTLSSCGFKMRGSGVASTLAHKKLATTFAQDSSLGAQFARVYTLSGGTLVPRPQDADWVLLVLQEGRDKVVVATNAFGLVREYQLRQWLRFEVKDSKGAVLVQSQELRVTRDISFNESAALAKEYEDAIVYQEMQNDLIQELLYKMTALENVK